ncbi:MAG: MarR family winged helix-turn-helix transcriptional regulator [Candidatus Nanopelagicales bacterium]
MTHANEHVGPRLTSATARQEATIEDRPALVSRLDHTINRMRRLVRRPPAGGVPIRALGRQIDLAKIIACEAIDDLSRLNEHVTVSDVADQLLLDRSTVSRLVGECEAEGLIRRSRIAGDARRVSLELTRDGKVAIADSAEDRCRFLGYVTETFDEADLNALVALMERFTDNVTTGLPQWLDSHGECVNNDAGGQS